MRSSDAQLTRARPKMIRSWVASVVAAGVAGATLWAVPAVAEDSGTVIIPSTPEIELVGEVPAAGDPATLQFTSVDAEAGVAGFWYGVNEEVRRNFVAAVAEPGVPATVEVTVPTMASGGLQWIYVWAEAANGRLSNRAVGDFFVWPPEPEPPVAVALARWPLSGDTEDVLGEHHLSMAGSEGADYDWVADRWCRPGTAWWTDGSGQGFAHSAGAVVPTQESFSLTAWVRVDNVADDQTVLSQAGAVRQAVRLQVTADGGARFAVPHRSPGRPSAGVAETEAGLISPDVWHHLVGVYDVPMGEVRLYLNGELAAAGAMASASWSAFGPLYLGIGGTARGATGEPLHGTLDLVEVWSDTLLPPQIRDMGRSGGSPLLPCF